MSRSTALLLAGLIALCGGGTLDVLGDEPPSIDPDERLLREAKIPTDGPGLLDDFRRRAESVADLQNIDALIRQLGSLKFDEREAASRKLVRIGPLAMPKLREAGKNSKDLETSRRADACVRELERDRRWAVPAVAVRTLIRLKPAGAVEALLQFLPLAPNQETEEEVWFGLESLVTADGKVDPVLVKALKDPIPARRAVAGCLSGRYGNEDQRIAARSLLTDADPLVRLRTAQGLLGAKDKSAVPTLIALLKNGPVFGAWQAEELLHWVAGKDAPAIVIGAGDAKARERCSAAWLAWWEKRRAGIDMAAPWQTPRRPCLFLATDPGRGGTEEGGVALLGCDGKPRWRIEGYKGPWDVRLAANDRVVFGDGGRLLECDLEGDPIREANLMRLREGLCHLLPSGNAFIFDGTGMAELTLDDEEKPYPLESAPLIGPQPPLGARPLIGSRTARNLGTGRVLCATNRAGEIVEVSTETGKVVRRVSIKKDVKVEDHELLFKLEQFTVEPLAGGRLLVAAYGLGKVLELDAEGNVAWEHEPDYPVRQAFRLRNGNTFLAYAGRAFEVTPEKKTVWEALLDPSLGTFRPCLGIVRLGFGDARPADLNLDSVGHRLKALKDEDPRVRAYAAGALSHFKGKDFEPAVPPLIEALADPEKDVRGAAQGTLAWAGAAGIEPLTKALKDPRVEVREGAINAIGGMGQQAKVALPALIEAAKGGEPSLRVAAVRIFGVIGPDAKVAVPVLRGILKDQMVEPAVRYDAVMTLSFIGPGAKDALPELMDTLNSEDLNLRRLICGVMAVIAPDDKEVLARLIKMLRQNPELRSSVACGLGKLGPGAKPAVPDLLAALDATDVNDPGAVAVNRESIVSALGSIGEGAKAAVPAIVKVLENDKENPSVRKHAATALGMIGDQSDLVMNALEKAWWEKDSRLSSAAEEALKRLRRLQK